jgi:glycosyltransferase involved in cell wall biosynthesis
VTCGQKNLFYCLTALWSLAEAAIFLQINSIAVPVPCEYLNHTGTASPVFSTSKKEFPAVLVGFGLYGSAVSWLNYDSPILRFTGFWIRVNIIQINTSDEAGGSERVMLSLQNEWMAMGHQCESAVGYVQSGKPGVRQLTQSSWRHLTGTRLQEIAAGLSRRGWLKTSSFIRTLLPVLRPLRSLGAENFGSVGVKEILRRESIAPDLVQAHNLHGGYFNLADLPRLCRRLPVVLTLHDSWLFSGHCAHGVDCERWITGCGRCPDLSIYPAISRDATAWNWKRKARIFSRCRLHVIAPSRWLMDRARQSLIWPSVINSAVIPNGVDLQTFRIQDRDACRRKWDLPNDVAVIMFAANGIRNNPFKDFQTLRAALEILGRGARQRIIALAVGDDPRVEILGSVELRFIRFQRDQLTMASLYGASDIYLHLARVDTFPTTVLEAMACGLPVVGSAVGGIPEQIRITASGAASGTDEPPTGILVAAGNAADAAAVVQTLISNAALARAMGIQGRAVAEREYSISRQATRYLEFYADCISKSDPCVA